MADQIPDSAKLQKLQNWLREPDFAEHFSTADLVDWLNRRPTSVIPSILATRAAPPAMDREAVGKLVEPWADYDGDLPDYDHPLRPVYESGIEYAVQLLAKELGVDEWERCDGTEAFDGDLGGTLMNIVLAAMPRDKDGDPIHPRDLLSTLSADAIRQGEGIDPVETRFWSVVDGAGLAAVPSDMWAALEVIARKSGHYDKQVRALHDAIMSPKGVVPGSADPYYRSSLCHPATPASHASDGGKA